MKNLSILTTLLFSLFSSTLFSQFEFSSSTSPFPLTEVETCIEQRMEINFLNLTANVLLVEHVLPDDIIFDGIVGFLPPGVTLDASTTAVEGEYGGTLVFNVATLTDEKTALYNMIVPCGISEALEFATNIVGDTTCDPILSPACDVFYLNVNSPSVIFATSDDNSLTNNAPGTAPEDSDAMINDGVMLYEEYQRCYNIYASDNNTKDLTLHINPEDDILITEISVSYFNSSSVLQGSATFTYTDDSDIQLIMDQTFLSTIGSNQLFEGDYLTICETFEVISCSSSSANFQTTHTLETSCTYGETFLCDYDNLVLNVQFSNPDTGFSFSVTDDPEGIISLCNGEQSDISFEWLSGSHSNPNQATKNLEELEFSIDNCIWSMDEILLNGIPLSSPQFNDILEITTLDNITTYTIDFSLLVPPTGTALATSLGLNNLFSGYPDEQDLSVDPYTSLPAGESLILSYQGLVFHNDCDGLHAPDTWPGMCPSGACDPYPIRLLFSGDDNPALLSYHTICDQSSELYDPAHAYIATHMVNTEDLEFQSSIDIWPDPDISGYPATEIQYDYYSELDNGSNLTLGPWHLEQGSNFTDGSNFFNCSEQVVDLVITMPSYFVLEDDFVSFTTNDGTVFSTDDVLTVTPLDDGTTITLTVTGLSLDPNATNFMSDGHFNYSIYADCECANDVLDDVHATLNAYCSNCPDTFMTIGCFCNQFFKHCVGFCTSTVGVESVTLERSTLGWTAEDLLTNVSPSDPIELGRIYNGDEMDYTAELYAGIPAEVDYDPSCGIIDWSAYAEVEPDLVFLDMTASLADFGFPDLYDIIEISNASFSVNGGTAIPVVGTPINSGTLPFPPLFGEGWRFVLPDAGTSAYDLLFTTPGVFNDVTFSADLVFKEEGIVDPDVYFLPMFFTNFKMISPTITEGTCDPLFGAGMHYLDVVPTLEVDYEDPLTPDTDLSFEENQSLDITPFNACRLRYRINQGTEGGYLNIEDFPNEFRHITDWNDNITLDLSGGLSFSGDDNDVKYAVEDSDWFNDPLDFNWYPSGYLDIGTSITEDGSWLRQDRIHHGRQWLYVYLDRVCPNCEGTITTNWNYEEFDYNPLSDCYVQNIYDASNTEANAVLTVEAENFDLVLDFGGPLFDAYANGFSTTGSLTYFNGEGEPSGVISGNWLYIPENDFIDVGTLTINGDLLTDGFYEIGDLGSESITIDFTYNCAYDENGYPSQLDLPILYGNSCFQYPTPAELEAIDPEAVNDSETCIESPNFCLIKATTLSIQPQESELSVEICSDDLNCDEQLNSLCDDVTYEISFSPEELGDVTCIDFFIEVEEGSEIVAASWDGSPITFNETSDPNFWTTASPFPDPDCSGISIPGIDASVFPPDIPEIVLSITLNGSCGEDILQFVDIWAEGVTTCGDHYESTHVTETPELNPIISNAFDVNIQTTNTTYSCGSVGSGLVNISLDPLFGSQDVFYVMCIPDFIILTSTSPTFDSSEPGDPGMTCYTWDLGTFGPGGSAAINFTFEVDGVICTSSALFDGTAYTEGVPCPGSECEAPFGLFGSGTNVIYINDNIPPTISLGPAQTLDCNSIPLCNVLTDGFGNITGISDDCTPDDEVVWDWTPQYFPPNDEYCAGHWVITYTAEDLCGNEATVIEIVPIEDDGTAPIVVAPPTLDVDCESVTVPFPDAVGTCSENTYGLPIPEIITTNCDGEITFELCIASDLINPDNSCPYFEVRWIISDNCGNTTVFSQTITLIDTEGPTIALEGIPVLECGQEPFLPFAFWDNCATADQIETNVDYFFEPSIGCAGGWVVTIDVIDACGNISTVNQIIPVTDNEGPTLAFGPAQSVDCQSLPLFNAWVTGDNCAAIADVNLTMVQAQIPPNGQYCAGAWIQTYIATDPCGNETVANEIIPIIDNTPPEIGPLDPLNVSCENPFLFPYPQATDNCGGQVTVTFQQSQIVDSDVACQEYYLNWTATDNCGNSASALQTVYIYDNEGPEITITQLPYVECGEELPPIQFEVTDNCSDPEDIATLFDSFLAENEGCAGVWHFTILAADECGNETQIFQTVPVQDNEGPTLDFGFAQTVDCQSLPLFNAWVSGDNCADAADVTLSSSLAQIPPSAQYCAGAWVQTYTATDPCGNETVVDEFIPIIDNTPPQIGPLDPLNVSCENPFLFPYPIATDNCGGQVNVTFQQSQIVDSDVGCQEYYLNWTATDNCGNSASALQTVYIHDDEGPEISIPSLPSVSCGEPLPEIPFEVTDNCTDADDIETQYFSTFFGNIGCEGLWYVVINATDECGNTTQLIETIPVEDNEPPVITQVFNQTLECGESPTIGAYVSYDNCADLTDIVFEVDYQQFPPNDTYCGGYWIVTYTATDPCGNTAVLEDVIEIIDNVPPVLPPLGDIQAMCGDLDNIPYPTATDECDPEVDISLIVNSIDDPGDSCPILHATWVATDNCGNTATADQYITLVDNEAPVFDMPLEVDGTCDPEPLELVVTDNCDDDLEVQFSSTTVVDGCSSITYMTWQVKDDCGNGASWTTAVISELTAPVLSEYPADLNVDCIDIPEVPEITASDECGPVEVVFEEHITGDGCDITIERCWTATGDCELQTIHCQTITAVDNEAPVITGEFLVEFDCEIPNDLFVTVVDDCDPDPLVTYEDVPFSGGCESYQRTYTATDDCGNTSTFIQIVSLEDDEPPVISGEYELDVDCSELDQLYVTVTDNCTVVEITYEDIYLSGGPCGNIERIYTATDACGNTTTFSQIIHIIDTEAPEFVSTPPEEISIDSISDLPPAEILEATDNCDDDVEITYSEEEYNNCPDEHVVKRVWVAEDDCGNTTEFIQTIYIRCDSCVCPQHTYIYSHDIDDCRGRFEGAYFSGCQYCESGTETYDWYVDGVLVYSGGSSLNYEFPGTGVYTLTFILTCESTEGGEITFCESEPLTIEACNECLCEGELFLSDYQIDGCHYRFYAGDKGKCKKCDEGTATYNWYIDGEVVATNAGSIFDYIHDSTDPFEVTFSISCMSNGVPILICPSPPKEMNGCEPEIESSSLCFTQKDLASSGGNGTENKGRDALQLSDGFLIGGDLSFQSNRRKMYSAKFDNADPFLNDRHLSHFSSYESNTYYSIYRLEPYGDYTLGLGGYLQSISGGTAQYTSIATHNQQGGIDQLIRFYSTTGGITRRMVGFDLTPPENTSQGERTYISGWTRTDFINNDMLVMSVNPSNGTGTAKSIGRTSTTERAISVVSIGNSRAVVLGETDATSSDGSTDISLVQVDVDLNVLNSLSVFTATNGCGQIPGSSEFVRDAVLVGDHIYATGFITTSDEDSKGLILKLDAYTLEILGYHVIDHNRRLKIRKIEHHDGKLYLAGDLGPEGGTIGLLIQLDISSGTPVFNWAKSTTGDFNNSAITRLFGITVDDNQLVLTGSYDASSSNTTESEILIITSNLDGSDACCLDDLVGFEVLQQNFCKDELLMQETDLAYIRHSGANTVTPDEINMLCQDLQLKSLDSFGQKASSQLSVRPNPFEQEFTLELASDDDQVKSYQIFDLSGNILLSEVLNTELEQRNIKVDLEHHSSGTYLLEVLTTNGNRYRERIVLMK